VYALKDMESKKFFGGAFVGWVDKKKDALVYDNDTANEGVSYWKSAGKNVKKVRI
jgi:hypothetical protein